MPYPKTMIVRQVANRLSRRRKPSDRQLESLTPHLLERARRLAKSKLMRRRRRRGPTRR